jgi:acetyl esterase/lipase
MKNIVYKMAEDFDIKKNYKLFRLFQKVVNPTINKKKKYQDIKIILEDRKVPIRVFNPFTDEEPHKIIIFLHGGGWVAGSVDTYTNICYVMARRTKRIVIAIEYRLAPENPFPAGFNDCYDVINLIYKNRVAMNIKTEDITIIGDSAGGNLSAAVCQRALNEKLFKVAKQILLYPSLQTDYSESTKYKSVIEKGSDYIITRVQLCDFINHYVINPNDLDNPYVAPLESNHLFGLPKTLIILAENDPLRDEGIAYYKKLRLHFVKSKHYIFKGATHGFLTNILDRKYTNAAYDKINEFLGDEHE